MAGEPSLFLVYKDFTTDERNSATHGMGPRRLPMLPRLTAAWASRPTRARSRCQRIGRRDGSTTRPMTSGASLGL